MTILADNDPLLGERIRYLGDVQRLRLRHNDVIVVNAPTQLSSAQQEQIKRQLMSALGSKRKVLVLQNGMKLGVLAPEDERSS